MTRAMKVLFKTRGSMNISERAGLQRDFFNKYNQRILKSTEKEENELQSIFCVKYF